MPHSLSIIIAAGLFGLSSNLALAQQVPPNRGNDNLLQEQPNRDEPQSRDQVPDRDTDRNRFQMPPRQSSFDQQIEKLSLATRDAIKALTAQIESLKARVAQLEAQQKR